MELRSFVPKTLKAVKRRLWPNSFQRRWKRIIHSNPSLWRQAKQSGKTSPRILIATSVGGNVVALQLETLLAIALQLRGAEVHFLLCDKVLSACSQVTTASFKDPKEFVRHGPLKSICDNCFPIGFSLYRRLGLPIHRYSQLLTERDRAETETLSASVDLANIKDYRFQDLALGEHALAGALRYFAKGTLEEEPSGAEVLKRYLKASFLTTFAVRKLLATYKFDCAVFHHGIYVPQGLTGEVCRQAKVRVVNWVPAYRKRSFIFSHGETYHHAMMREPTHLWENLNWTPEMESILTDYLKSRIRGRKDWISFQHTNPQEDLEIISRHLGIDFSKPTVGLLTNVVWDAQLHYPANAFVSQHEWLYETIRYFEKRSNLQLIIRVHPAEKTGWLPSRQPLVADIQKMFPNLAKNIFIIPPENHISTYSVMHQCDSVIIFATKTGIELTSSGIPVIVAGEAWIRNKGLTIDVHSKEEYYKLLTQLPLKKRLSREAVYRARKYAYHFFFRRMIPLSFIDPQMTTRSLIYKMNIKSLGDLMPQADPGLDIICNGILKEEEFIYPAERTIRSQMEE